MRSYIDASRVLDEIDHTKRMLVLLPRYDSSDERYEKLEQHRLELMFRLNVLCIMSEFTSFAE